MAQQDARITAAGKELPDFAQVVARYQARLYRVALRQLGNPEDAQDAVQEALLAAYRHLDQFQGRAELSTWLTRIVINAARGQRRRALSRPAASLEEVSATGRQFADHAAGPEARCLEHERHERLERLLQRLSPPLREVVVRCELRGQTMRQAAAGLGIKAPTLKCRLFRARRRLGELASASPGAKRPQRLARGLPA